MMRKEKFAKNISQSKDFPCEMQYNIDNLTDINLIKIFIDNAIQNGATHIEWEFEKDCDGYVEVVTMQPKMVYEETEDQMKERLEKDRLQQEANARLVEQKQRRLYEQLKAKYEN